MPLTVPPVIDQSKLSGQDQPSIRVDGELLLRPFVSGDAEAVLRAFATPDIQLYHGFRIDDIAEADEWIRRTHSLWSEAKSADWAIDDSASVLGRCALHVDCRRGTAEIAYWVLPEARRRGAATRSVIAVTNWAHTSLGVHRILLQHSTANAASRVVAERAGYVAEGIARQQDIHTDGWHDMQQHSHPAID